MTSSDKSVRNILDARDSRQDALSRVLSEGRPASVFLSLNIPGAEQCPPGACAFFDAMLNAVSACFPTLVTHLRGHDALGPFAIASLELDPFEVKRQCISLETNHPSARLLDLDVYSADGIQIDRGRVGSPRRSCLVCNLPAVECMRLKRHSADEIIGKAHELLANFGA